MNVYDLRSYLENKLHARRDCGVNAISMGVGLTEVDMKGGIKPGRGRIASHLVTPASPQY